METSYIRLVESHNKSHYLQRLPLTANDMRDDPLRRVIYLMSIETNNSQEMLDGIHLARHLGARMVQAESNTISYVVSTVDLIGSFLDPSKWMLATQRTIATLDNITKALIEGDGYDKLVSDWAQLAKSFREE